MGDFHQSSTGAGKRRDPQGLAFGGIHLSQATPSGAQPAHLIIALPFSVYVVISALQSGHICLRMICVLRHFVPGFQTRTDSS